MKKKVRILREVVRKLQGKGNGVGQMLSTKNHKEKWKKKFIVA